MLAPPETMTQAQTWDKRTSQYVCVGYCGPCAGQAAYGHQNGFSTVHPPCSDCSGLTPPPGRGERADRWASSTTINN